MNRRELLLTIDKVISGMKNLKVTIEEDTPESIISINKWDWSQGVGLFSLYRYYKETNNREILSYLIDWFDARIREGLPSKNVNTMCPLLTLTYLYEETHNPEYLELCKEWASYAADEMPRTPEFGITHVTLEGEHYGELWDDTLYMTVLFIGRMGVLLNRDDYVQESVRQFLVHMKYLTDTQTGLFYHGWSFVGKHNFAKALWGRGNAWYSAGLVDYLDMVKIPLGVEIFLVTSLERQVEQLALLQSESGMWHTLLDDPSSYEETSATAGFAYSMLKAIRKGYIVDEYADAAFQAMKSVLAKIDEQGMVHGVSYGTRMGHTLDFYKRIPQCPMPYGQSMALLMLVESLHHIPE
ncbi:glycoside hydrolase family 105 protein [Paenibacillus cremeus]|uniref:Glycoside hydrolase family 105 protein n=1 Tax=Paenibacillus cremeus TaxID=2163881 RepID=A0A559K6M4_9BACL|nr:glycoside hydrolase family 105 protein [Paenibacillus cremeus]